MIENPENPQSRSSKPSKTEKTRKDASLAVDRSFLSAIKDGIIIINRDGNILDYNDSAERILKLELSLNKNLKKNLSGIEVYTENLSPINFNYFPPQLALTEKKDQIDCILAIKSKKENELSWIKANSTIIADSNGEIASIVTTFSDITETENSKKALIVSEKKTRSIFESIVEGLLAIDANGRITDCNVAAESLLYSSREELLEVRNFTKRWQFITEDGKPLREEDLPFNLSLKFSKPVRDFNLGFSNPLGETVWISMNAQPVYAQNEKKPNFVILSLSDVSERKWVFDELLKNIEELKEANSTIEKKSSELEKLNRMLQDSEVQLKQTNASKDKFFSIIAHDLKNPLLALKDLARTIHSDFEAFDTNELKEMSNDLSVTAENVFKLLENLLEWSRIQMGRMPFNPESFDLKAVVELNVNIQKAAASNKKIKIIKKIKDGANVFADLNMINAIVRNILSNAIKFTFVEGSIEIAVKKNSGMAVLSIKDSGCGMSNEQIDKLFRIDTHQTSLGTCGEKGTGLGLALCKELIDMNGGDIKVLSSEGKGSTFIVSIPLA